MEHTKTTEMKKTLNIIPKDPDLVFIALNPTEEAIAKNAVFSRDNGFWNLLVNAEIIRNSIFEVALENRAEEVFLKQNYSDIRLGFADLLPLITETDSKKVKVPENSAIKLFETTDHFKNSKRIALLGQKVVDSFAKDYKLTSWRQIPVNEGKRQFGKIGEIVIEKKAIEIFAMPFPVNNSIENKHKIYSTLVK